jgi:hypothetical protein
MNIKIFKMHRFKKTFTLPFNVEISHYTKNFLLHNNFFKRYLKFLKRYLFIVFKRQNTLEIDYISPNHKKVLWINISAPSIGDSLMDLSSRVLIDDRKIDLYTHFSNAKIYEYDLFISKVFTNKALINQYDYDLIILDSYSTRSIRIKNDVAPKLPFVGMYGFFNGPEVNRVLFSFNRMNHLLGYTRNENEISKIAKASLSIGLDDKKLIARKKMPNHYISIAVGGEWPYRTFNQWDLVIERLLIENNMLNIVLVGSENGNDIAQSLVEKFLDANIINCVGKFSFNQTTEIINKSQILLCCDGGLMHAANSVSTPIVPLFARLSEQMQLTDSICSFSLFDELDVNNIPFEDICDMYLEAYNCIEMSSIS